MHFLNGRTDITLNVELLRLQGYNILQHIVYTDTEQLITYIKSFAFEYFQYQISTLSFNLYSIKIMFSSKMFWYFVITLGIAVTI